MLEFLGFMDPKTSSKPGANTHLAILQDAKMILELVTQGEADIRQGRVLSQDQALTRVRSRLRGV